MLLILSVSTNKIYSLSQVSAVADGPADVLKTKMDARCHNVRQSNWVDNTFAGRRAVSKIKQNKKLSYHRGTAQRAMLVNSAMFHDVWKLEKFPRPLSGIGDGAIR